MAKDLLPLAIPPGVVRGATPMDNRGRWWDTNLVRWRNGVLEPVGGWERVTGTPFANRVRKIDVWRSNNGIRLVMVATDGQLFVEKNGTYDDFTPGDLATSEAEGELYGFGIGPYGAEAYGTARTLPSFQVQTIPAYWTISGWGEDRLVMLSTDGRLFHYDTSAFSSNLSEVAGVPIDNTAVHVTPERHAMLLQCGGNKRRVGWSSREDFADFNFSSTTNTAGYLDLETSTALLKAADSRAGTLVFSGSDVFLMSYVGMPYVYGRQWLGATRVVGPDTIVADNGNVFWWASDGFKMFDGGAIRTLDCPVWDYVMSRADKETLPRYSHGGSVGLYPEVWWFYASKESTVAGGLIDSYVMVNYVEGWWAIGKLKRTALAPAGADVVPYMAGEDMHLYQHEKGWIGATGIRDVYAESNAIAVGNGGRFMNIKQVLAGSGFGFDATQLRFYTDMTPEGAEREFGPYLTRADGYTDVRVGGRDIRVRVEAIKDQDWSLGVMRLDAGMGEGR